MTMVFSAAVAPKVTAIDSIRGKLASTSVRMPCTPFAASVAWRAGSQYSRAWRGGDQQFARAPTRGKLAGEPNARARPAGNAGFGAAGVVAGARRRAALSASQSDRA